MNVGRRKLHAALGRILAGAPKRIDKNRRLSISAVAQEAGLSNAAVHNCYPEFISNIKAEIAQKYGPPKPRQGPRTSDVLELRRDLAKLASNQRTVELERDLAQEEIKSLKAELARVRTLLVEATKQRNS